MTAQRPPFSVVLRRILDAEAGRKRPLAVLWRFAVWQTWRRVVRKPMRFQVLTGTRMRLLPDASDSLSGFWYHEIPDFEELCFALHLLRPGELFVDVGANQGGWSLTMAGMGARVIAFEPVPLTFERLQANVGQNPTPICQRVRAIPCALGEDRRQVRFTSDRDAGNHRIKEFEEENGLITVDLDRADSVLRGEQPVAIKIDVEGEELGVLKGAKEILSSPDLMALIIETFRPQNAKDPSLIDLEGILEKHGFLPIAYDPWTREVRPLTKQDEGSQNTIYLRNSEKAVSRLRSAAPLSAFGCAI